MSNNKEALYKHDVLAARMGALAAARTMGLTDTDEILGAAQVYEAWILRGFEKTDRIKSQTKAADAATKAVKEKS